MGHARVSGEETRGGRLCRLLAVQKQKRKLCEWKLADLEGERQALEAEAREILESLGEQSLLHGLFLEAKAAALRRNDVKLSAVAVRLEDARATLREAQAMEKRVERAADEAVATERAEAEKLSLLLALDDYLSARAASFE